MSGNSSNGDGPDKFNRILNSIDALWESFFKGFLLGCLIYFFVHACTS